MTQRPTPPGTSGAVCAACWRVFNSPTAFDMHQTQGAATVCHDPADVGMVILRKHQGHPVWGTKHRQHIPHTTTERTA